MRSSFRAKRSKLSSLQQQSNAVLLAKHLVKFKAFNRAKNIAVYLSSDNEIDLQPLINTIWKNKKNCYLPVLDKQKKGYLHFLPYHCAQKLVKNKFNIAEPKYETKLAIKVAALDIIFMPLVSFDKQLNRLGMGGGFYDRSLAVIKNHSKDKPIKPLLVGVAHSIQQADKIPSELWDIKVDYLFSEKGNAFL